MSRREARKSLLIKATTPSAARASAATSTQRGQLESLTRGKQQLHSIVGSSLFFFGKDANHATDAVGGISDALADAVLGEFDLAHADFVFRLAAGDSAFVAEVRCFFSFFSLLPEELTVENVNFFKNRSNTLRLLSKRLTRNSEKVSPNAAMMSFRSAPSFSASTMFSTCTLLHLLWTAPRGVLPFPTPPTPLARNRCSRYGWVFVHRDRQRDRRARCDRLCVLFVLYSVSTMPKRVSRCCVRKSSGTRRECATTRHCPSRSDRSSSRKLRNCPTISRCGRVAPPRFTSRSNRCAAAPPVAAAARGLSTSRSAPTTPAANVARRLARRCRRAVAPSAAAAAAAVAVHACLVRWWT
jgi:hypothetical protein